MSGRGGRVLAWAMVVAALWAMVDRNSPAEPGTTDVATASAAMAEEVAPRPEISASSAAPNVTAAPKASAPTESVWSPPGSAPASVAPRVDAGGPALPIGVTDTPPTTTPSAPPAAPSSSAAHPERSPAALGAEAVSAFRYPFAERFPEWEVVFLDARRSLRALTFPGERRIEIYVRTTDTAASVHRVLAHEVGHLVDVELNSGSDRRRWAQQRGFADGVPWWPSASAPDFATGAGDFAEAFAVWETGVTGHSTVATQPDEADLALLAELSS